LPLTTVFDLQVIENQPGFISFKISGKKAEKIFKNEAGGHRWQRIPETEKRGRVHTSTITVAVLDDSKEQSIDILDSDLEWNTRRGSGPGGQHRNKTDSCVDLKHLPTGIVVSIDGRSQHKNKRKALEILKNKLEEIQFKQASTNENKNRKNQIGCGMRGDKRRTIRVQDNLVTDHILNKKISYKDYSRGKIDKLL
jgi:peptide chain release factor 1